MELFFLFNFLGKFFSLCFIYLNREEKKAGCDHNYLNLFENILNIICEYSERIFNNKN